jgi:dihydrodipicolinate synthase/N-acetylneuraminate lyase
VLPTPFDAQGRPDAASLRRLVDYLIRCGVDGMTYPGVASEVGQLAPDERQSLLDAVLSEVAGRVPVIAGVSSSDTATTVRLAAQASARGAAGTMPAIELAEVHTALFKAHREGDADRVRTLFTRMLPVLNVQAVFRWSLTKYVLKKRGLVADTRQRMPGPLLDAFDMADVDAFLADIEDLLLPQDQLP